MSMRLCNVNYLLDRMNLVCAAMTMTRPKLSLVAQFDDLQRNGRVLTQGIETGMRYTGNRNRYEVHRE